MHRANIFVAALSALSAVTAQNLQNFTVDFNLVPIGTRASWCTAESNTCNMLCGGYAPDNGCDPNTLAYSCKCTNGSAPGLQYYTQTMYTFTCEEAFSECITANQNNATGQSDCTNNIKNKCGTLDPNKADVGTSSSSSSTSAAATTSAASSASAASATTTSSHNAAPTAAFFGNGAAAVAAGVLAAALL